MRVAQELLETTIRRRYYHQVTSRLHEGRKFGNLDRRVRWRLQWEFRRRFVAELKGKLASGSNQFVIAVIGPDDALDKRVAHDVSLVEIDKRNPFHAL